MGNNFYFKHIFDGKINFEQFESKSFDLSFLKKNVYRVSQKKFCFVLEGHSTYKYCTRIRTRGVLESSGSQF